MTTFKTLAYSLLGLTLVAASASSQALSLASFLHMHPRAVTSQRATLKLENSAATFHDVRVGDKVYTVGSHHSMTITAPVGTPVFAADRMYRMHAKGAVVAQVTNGNQTVVLN